MVGTQKTIELQQQQVEYTFKPSVRARRLRLSVYPGGAFVVTAPQRMPESIIEQFIIKKGQWIVEKIEHFKQYVGFVGLRGGRRQFLQHKEAARALVARRLIHFNTFYGFTWHRISIRNQKTRWGSCSKDGNLNFNYKIALLPERLADYIVVHELCHLGQFNHSKYFWALVARTIPDYKEIMQEFKKYGIILG